VLHGTAFAYRRQGSDTLFLTNEHVAVWPSVTDVQHPVEGVRSGCKKVSESIVLVDDEHDSYARDDVPLTRVAADPRLDVAILRGAGSDRRGGQRAGSAPWPLRQASRRI